MQSEHQIYCEVMKRPMSVPWKHKQVAAISFEASVTVSGTIQ